MEVDSDAAGDDDFNIQAYTPSVLLAKGQLEYKFFNSLYVQTRSFASSGTSPSQRWHFYTQIHQFLYGINKSINVGGDVWLKSVRNDVEGSSLTPIIPFSDSDNTRFDVTWIGPKVKVSPFKKLAGLSIQSTFFLPVAKDQEGANENSDHPFLEKDVNFLWLNQLFFDHTFNSKWSMFVQLSGWYFNVRDSFLENNALESPLTGFISWFPTQRITIYAQNEYWAKHYDGFSSSWFYQSGLGGKYQIIPGTLEGEALYTRFLAGTEGEGAGQTFNLGIRYIR